MRKKLIILILISSILLSAAAHFFFLQEWFNGRFMIGPNDGLSQIVPFKTFIYENYKQGNFFYSWQFGLGGGFYSQLAYYFSTSIVFLVTAGVVFFMESVHIISPPDLLFWMNATIIVSILRLSFILMAATIVYRYMNINTIAAFTGAAVYGLSVMYFRHVIFWEFFADAMLWVPLLVLGIEKIIREEKPGWFILTVSLMLISNFYFAYINLIFLLIFVLFRWMIPLTEGELHKWKQLKLFFVSGLISFCISAISFIPAVYGYFNNHRPPYQKEVPLFDFSDDILFSSRYIILPAIFILLVLTVSIYRHHVFKLFAYLSFLFIVLHFSPLAGSVFNGFSAPQYRWEYLLSFTAGGLVAAGLHHLKEVNVRWVLASMTGAVVLYISSAYSKQNTLKPSVQVSVLLMTLSITIVLILLFIWKKKNGALLMLQVWVLLSSILAVNVYGKYMMSEKGPLHTVSSEFLNSTEYNSLEQRQLLEEIKKEEGHRLFRIDWMNGVRNNTPIVQNFNGTSLYSSIFNQELLYFYWHHLKIDMGRESVSRYATLGNRANLHSLLQANYWLREKNKNVNAPYGFEKFVESEHYVVYKNTMPLPFIRTTKNVFSERDLQIASPLEREHAMLEGVILGKENQQVKGYTKEKNLINDVLIESIGAIYKNNILTVTEKTGGIDLIPEQQVVGDGDVYISLYIENINGKGFSLQVNDYRTSRKHGDSIYKTGVNDLMIRVPQSEKVSIRLPEGSYIVKELKFYKEDYHELRNATEKAAHNLKFEWKQNKLSIDFDNDSREKYMILPIPYEKGWELQINGEKQPIEKANYAFTSFALKEGKNNIHLIYYPPYFKLSLFMTLAGLLTAMLFEFFVKRRKNALHLKKE
ncbi:YfhO family protein [Bacillus sp. 37MA]|uniref:YfhO family protein n=1 Tax=Bacillus sp. 37MA TaxID=1132442 RepID=UPI00037FFCE0|nr:YfhO family protein [Bacillus sp. 37MA]